MEKRQGDNLDRRDPKNPSATHPSSPENHTPNLPMQENHHHSSPENNRNIPSSLRQSYHPFSIGPTNDHLMTFPSQKNHIPVTHPSPENHRQVTTLSPPENHLNIPRSRRESYPSLSTQPEPNLYGTNLEHHRSMNNLTQSPNPSVPVNPSFPEYELLYKDPSFLEDEFALLRLSANPSPLRSPFVDSSSLRWNNSPIDPSSIGRGLSNNLYPQSHNNNITDMDLQRLRVQSAVRGMSAQSHSLPLQLRDEVLSDYSLPRFNLINNSTNNGGNGFDYGVLNNGGNGTFGNYGLPNNGGSGFDYGVPNNGGSGFDYGVPNNGGNGGFVYGVPNNGGNGGFGYGVPNNGGNGGFGCGLPNNGSGGFDYGLPNNGGNGGFGCGLPSNGGNGFGCGLANYGGNAFGYGLQNSEGNAALGGYGVSRNPNRNCLVLDSGFQRSGRHMNNNFEPENSGASTSSSSYNNHQRSRQRLSNWGSSVSLEELKGRVLAMAKDQQGCRWLQKKFEEGKPEEIQMIFLEVKDHVKDLMVDHFGNYFMQKFFEVCNEEQITQILVSIIRNECDFRSICLDTHGTRAVQKLLENLRTRDQISLVISVLRRITVALIKSTSGNHVIQHCLKIFSNEDNRHLLNVVADNCLDIATDKSGCCVLQQCVQHAREEPRDRLVAEITTNALVLSEHPFGNYVVQFILGMQIGHVTRDLLTQLQGNFVTLSMNKFGSNVVEKCLKESGTENSALIVNELVESKQFSMVLQDPYGNYVAQSALDASKGLIRHKMVTAIQNHYASLHSHPHGKRVLAKIKGNRHHHRMLM